MAADWRKDNSRCISVTDTDARDLNQTVTNGNRAEEGDWG
jgi:hypothetical protein